MRAMVGVLVVSTWALAQDAGTPGRGSITERLTTRLSKGNTQVDFPPSPTPFQQLCRTVASGCAFNRALWELPMPTFQLDTDGEFQVLKPHRLFTPTSAFDRCLAKGLLGQRIPIDEKPARAASCLLHGLTRSQLDPHVLSGEVGACLGRDTTVTQVTVQWAQVIEENRARIEDVRVDAEPRLDLSTESCIRQAISVPPFEFVEADRPTFTRRETTVVVQPWQPTRAPLAVPDAVKRRLKPPSP